MTVLDDVKSSWNAIDFNTDTIVMIVCFSVVGKPADASCDMEQLVDACM